MGWHFGPLGGDSAEGCASFSRRGEVPALAARLAQLCANADLVELGLNELMLNAIEHGLLGIGFERKRTLIESGCWPAEVEWLEARREPGMGSVVVQYRRINELICFTVRNPGDGFDCSAYMSVALAHSSAPNGRGIAIARQLCFESLCYRNGGREVEALAIAR